MSEEQELSQLSPKRGRRRERQGAPELVIGAYRSYWPLALAISLIVLFTGVIIHPIILTIGCVLTVAAIIGWGLERR